MYNNMKVYVLTHEHYEDEAIILGVFMTEIEAEEYRDDWIKDNKDDGWFRVNESTLNINVG